MEVQQDDFSGGMAAPQEDDFGAVQQDTGFDAWRGWSSSPPKKFLMGPRGYVCCLDLGVWVWWVVVCV
jgi:hypothetical protein